MVRWLLGSVLSVVAINAFAGGVYGLLGAPGVPRSMLANTPFATFVVPSAILLFVVGGSALAAAIAVWRRAHVGKRLALAAGAVLLGWIIAQVAFIGPVSWLQPTMAIAAVVELALGLALPQSRGSSLTSTVPPAS